MCRQGKAGDDARVPEVSRDIPLDVKLKELDALYAPKLAEAGANRAKHDTAVKRKG